MILKASQRGGGKQLAVHLMNTADNEHVDVHDVRGFVSEDVQGAMKEAYAVSQGTRCKQFLFSVSLSPPQNENVPPEIFENAVERIEEKNGLTGQPRIIVFHEKEGRRHAHAVWSRIDAQTMTAKNLPHFKLKLRDISKELYLENDWKMPRGLMDSKARDPRNFDLAEWQQSKRIGQNARDLKAMMQECWAASDSKQAFQSALEERGLYLAKGDRRGHVAVTHEGEVLSIARYTGKKAKDIRARLGEPDGLRSVKDTKSHIAETMTPVVQRHMEEARRKQARDKTPLERERQRITQMHREERAKLNSGQEQRWAEETKARSVRLNTGIKGVWDRLTGQHKRTQKQNEAEAYAALLRDREQRQSIIEAQLEERRALQERIQAMRQNHTRQIQKLTREITRYEEMGQPGRNTNSVARTFNTSAKARTSPDQRLERLRSTSRLKPSDLDRER